MTKKVVSISAKKSALHQQKIQATPMHSDVMKFSLIFITLRCS